MIEPITCIRVNETSPCNSFEGSPLTYFSWSPGEPQGKMPPDTHIFDNSTAVVMVVIQTIQVNCNYFAGYNCENHETIMFLQLFNSMMKTCNF